MEMEEPDDGMEYIMEPIEPMEVMSVNYKVNKSRTYCCVPQCNSCSDAEGPEGKLSFHKIPKFDDFLREEWIRALKIRKEVRPYMVVCSRHFREEDYCSKTHLPIRRRLKKTAVPSLNLGPDPIISIDVERSSSPYEVQDEGGEEETSADNVVYEQQHIFLNENDGEILYESIKVTDVDTETPEVNNVQESEESWKEKYHKLLLEYNRLKREHKEEITRLNKKVKYHEKKKNNGAIQVHQSVCRECLGVIE